MDYIRRSLDIIQGKLPTDKNSFNHALKEIKDRRKEIVPLIKECFEKEIHLKELDQSLSDEWNEITKTLILIELLFNYEDSLKKAQENYNEYKSLFNKLILENNIHLVDKFKKKLLKI